MTLLIIAITIILLFAVNAGCTHFNRVDYLRNTRRCKRGRYIKHVYKTSKTSKTSKVKPIKKIKVNYIDKTYYI